MALVSIKDLHLTYGHPPLFDGAELHINEGDRLCLLGRNGAGKSTLLRLIAGTVDPDDGVVAVSRGLSVTYVNQETPGQADGTALGYCETAGAEPVAASKALTQFGIPPESEFSTLSGGAKRRVALAAGLAQDADLLLVDEPTNHLDIDAILWLEEYLVRSVRSLVLVTHDRAFARKVTNRVAQIDRGTIHSFDADFDTFLRLRDNQLDSEEEQNQKFDKLLAREEAWLRRGVKARRTRDEGRVRSLLRMREEYEARRTAPGQVRITVDEAGRSGKLVFEATEVSFAYPDGPPVIQNLTTTVMRGDKVGIVGPNGSGKTTLVKVLLGELEPTDGNVRQGVNVEPLYFDQIRTALDPQKSVIENISGGDDTVVIGGKAKHINAYLEQFLFEPDRAKMDVGYLSGGEQNRVLLAKLFTQSSNLLILDEPTNDLDLETLDLLEEMLTGFSGTVLLVTHDREFLDRVVTSSLVLAGDGTVQEFAGGYSDWKDRARWSAATAAGSGSRRGGGEARGDAPGGDGARRGGPDPRARGDAAEGRDSARTGGRTTPGAGRTDRPRKRSYKENRELEALPDRIAELEQEIEALQHQLADPELYARSGSDGEEVRTLTAGLQEREEELARAFARWEELDAKES